MLFTSAKPGNRGNSRTDPSVCTMPAARYIEMTGSLGHSLVCVEAHVSLAGNSAYWMDTVVLSDVTYMPLGNLTLTRDANCYRHSEQ